LISVVVTGLDWGVVSDFVTLASFFCGALFWAACIASASRTFCSMSFLSASSAPPGPALP
jgi:hypothetical protein